MQSQYHLFNLMDKDNKTIIYSFIFLIVGEEKIPTMITRSIFGETYTYFYSFHIYEQAIHCLIDSAKYTYRKYPYSETIFDPDGTFQEDAWALEFSDEPDDFYYKNNMCYDIDYFKKFIMYRMPCPLDTQCARCDKLIESKEMLISTIWNKSDDSTPIVCQSCVNENETEFFKNNCAETHDILVQYITKCVKI